MDLPVTIEQPIEEADSQALLGLGWEWINWLKDWRQKYESGELAMDKALQRQVSRYFSRFRHPGGFISLAQDYSSMPFDARVDFIYIPTITALSIQNLAGLALGNHHWDRRMVETLIASAGRKLQGHGYDGERYMAYNIELLAYGKVLSSYSKQVIPSKHFHEGIINCYKCLTRSLLEPPNENDWGRISPQGASYCLKLLYNDENNWALLQQSPLLEAFARDLKPSHPPLERLQRNLFDEQ